MNRVIALFLLIICLCIPLAGRAQTDLPDEETLRSWVQAMKSSPKGPFKYIRWFCNDGSILPPKAYACKDHGGGIQHGMWSDRVQTMRDNGYFIANIFAQIKPDDFLKDPRHLEILKQMILEQFLIGADDGWILREARYYRGALQTEDETRGGRDLLLALLKDIEMHELRYTVLREAVRLLPHGRSGAPISEMRQLTLAIAEKDRSFEKLRIKLHVLPELSDADRVRTYAEKRGMRALLPEYKRLATLIEAIYQPKDIASEIAALAKEIKPAELKFELQNAAQQLTDATDPAKAFAVCTRLLASLRQAVPSVPSPSQALALMDISLVLEGELFRSGNELLDELPQASRRQRLNWLIAGLDAAYGIGLISERQRQALADTLTALTDTPPSLPDYKAELNYAAQIPTWADRTLRFHFSETVAHFEVIEPISRRYIHDRVHGSLLMVFSAVLESLMADADRHLGIASNLFGQSMSFGLRGLNAGLARGILRVLPDGEPPENLDRRSIYVLPVTMEELPPVAGIITAGEGNILSHVQLLARNLGIPNTAADTSLLPQIRAKEGQRVVLAVSPGGIVQLSEDGPGWDSVFAEDQNAQAVRIQPDLDKLDLLNQRFISLQDLRAADSGRLTGPKAANLGELKYHFTEAVPDGLVIPFAFFRALLERPIEPHGPSVFSWMQEQYQLIRSMDGHPEKQGPFIRDFLQRMQDWILNTDPGDQFREALRKAMAIIFDPNGSYGVFVRSDTNVEDLPGFSGAGLNLTVPNVVGFDNVLKAIRQVWASPFSERAYRWRQAYMDSPEHVYASVLLQKSIPVEKSGVLVTVDVDTGRPGWLTVAVNEGIGGAVSGQTAEELRINTETDTVRLMAHATEPQKRILLAEGGTRKIPASGTDAVLGRSDIAALIKFAASIPERFPALQDEQGKPVAADIEFGFYQDKLVLFQIRPFLESARARQNLFLNSLDRKLQDKRHIVVDLDKIPERED